MATQESKFGGGYALLMPDGRPVCDYIGITEGDAVTSSQVLTEPLEGGQLAAFNKVLAPQTVKVTLALGYDPAVQTASMGKLKALCRRVGEGALCIYVTPSGVYERMAVEMVGESRRSSAGATLLLVALSLTQVNAVQVQVQSAGASAAWSPKNATAADPVNAGRAQPAKRSLSLKMVKGVS